MREERERKEAASSRIAVMCLVQTYLITLSDSAELIDSVLARGILLARLVHRVLLGAVVTLCDDELIREIRGTTRLQGA